MNEKLLTQEQKKKMLENFFCYEQSSTFHNYINSNNNKVTLIPKELYCVKSFSLKLSAKVTTLIWWKLHAIPSILYALHS